jgi:hypothetical protein
MNYLAWLVMAGVGGTAAILGSLMTLGCCTLWLSSRDESSTRFPSSDKSGRYGVLKLLGISLLIAGIGWTLLALMLWQMPLVSGLATLVSGLAILAC